ncbi:hypothetical protein J2Z22_002408 [Paenibacillus forsythiae]|uniref:Uncharacterized protein n=1 Tax=Paenibacillus forsythiae TaxID=365616 RepID=A0ABU3H7U1_9BACL|nr:hypothetical protein [Paenibacillus forsythiae]MDT3426874.1 hypothetical protein [Paenibacillus forsythiae]
MEAQRLAKGQKVQAFQIQIPHASRNPDFMQVFEAILAECKTEGRKNCIVAGV